MYNDDLRYSKQSSNYIDYTKRKEISMYGKGAMFTQDFSFNFSISLRKSRKHKKFYEIKAPDEKLEQLLNFNRVHFLKYDLDNILSSNVKDLLLYGRAYVEKVLCYDSDNNLVGISFYPFHYKNQISIGKKLYYRIKKYNGDIESGIVEHKNLIIFKLKDLGYSKRYFKRKIKRLGELNLPDFDLYSNQNSGFDLLLYNKRQDYKFLKIMKDVYWNGRNYSNEYVSYPYSLYRVMKFDLIRNKFLEYLLKGYNTALKELGEKYGFSGEIVYESKVEEYDSLINDLKNGKKNCKQVSESIFN
ncbi:hypothetical protein CJD_A0428 [Clostridium perfringens D str. JGS1721]|uniref:Uncharacterized protein n=1 Tax=Clostridium perfringens D str. JGS1721 TaxID=488537 RepID=B1V7H4_CLOPF|nr:hypothetical protein [Clostridium perfringens]EDT70228.1 hypothetical protein CJD_A0428 [Clostridium perfringens D str. JGS1721]